MNPQLEGIEDLEGTYPFDIRQSIKGLRLNRFLWQLKEPENRRRWVEERTVAYDLARLTPEERALVDANDWLGMVQYGVSFFVLEKLARVVKITNLGMYAIMRGESLEEFLLTRRVPGAV